MYDAIIVGARCGGAPLAMLLARQGHKVLLLDRMPIGSDVMSTHYVKRAGASLLQKWGLLEQLRATDTPAISELTFKINDVSLTGRAPGCNGVDTDFTPRRTCLDPILVRAAEAAGAEVRDQFTVSSLVFDGNRVVGVKGASPAGADIVEHAKIVVGADGPRSLVARSAGADLCIDAGTHTCGYYAYYSGIRRSDHAASLHILTDQRRFAITFPTNDGLDMLFLFWPAEEAREVRRDLDAAFDDTLARIPELQGAVKQGRRETRITGTHLLPNYFRQAHGPGWALVGDAALHRDPITAQGITNAFTHADILGEELGRALAEGRSVDTAAAAYDRRQFEALKPMFDYTVHLAMLQPLPAEIQAMLPVIADDPKAVGSFIGAFLGSVPLEAVFPPNLIQRFADDAARGQKETAHVH